MAVTVSSTHDAQNPSSPDAAPQFWKLSRACREVRLGLVVYGGVSLAIYINGVADELFRAVRGRGIYKLLKRLLDADIVVDIVSGTSAGGINGLLLAYALTNEREFSDCAALWRDHGSLSKLLRLTDDEANATSLLDSRNYYIPRLEDALLKMGRVPAAEEQKERPSRFDELDLFVTGTNFDGRMTTTVDATGRQIDIKTHRTVFHLKHRARRKTPLAVSPNPSSDHERATVSALARLAAITSCFPAAFEPVRVAPSDGDAHEQAVYSLLKEWGQLDGEAWFLDGGVLDNKPFSYTIQQIFNRTASRPVERKLFYVEPDPERFDPSARRIRTGPPTVVEAAVDALLGIPGYESIAEDLDRIAKRNDRLQRQARVRTAAESAFRTLRAEMRQSPQAAVPPSVMAIYGHARLSQLSGRAVEGLMEGEGFKRPCDTHRKLISAEERRRQAEEDQHRRAAAAALARAFDAWEGVGEETLERFDVYFRRRRTFYVIYQIAGEVSRLCGGDAASERKDKWLASLTQLRMAWETLNQQLAAYEIVQWAMEQVLDRQKMPRNLQQAGAADAVWRDLQTKFEYLLKVDDRDIAPLFEPSGDTDTAAPTGFSESQRQRLSEVLKSRLMDGPSQDSVPPLAPQESRNLLQNLDDHTRRLLREQLPADRMDLADEWDEFVVYDAHFFPIDYFADLGEKDPIEVVRISPLDAERAFCSRRFEDKVTGETVMHFGAFLKRSWRSNDIMWGRLDGVCRILDALLAPEALTKSMANPEVRQLLREDLESGALDPANVFPSAGAPIQKKLQRWLEQLAGDDDEARARAAGDQEMHTLLLWCAQLEILDTDLPTVLVDAATEQLEWNNLIVKDSKGRSSFKPLGARLDLSSAVIAGRELTQQFIDRLRKNPAEFSDIPKAPLAKHFLEKYTVGSENPRDDIPPAILLETVTAALLVARNCLVNAFPDHATKVTSSLLYKALVHWPLTTAHTLAVLARRERPLYVAGIAAVVTYAVLALTVALRWPTETLMDVNYDVDRTSVLALVVIPLIILLPGMRIAWARAHRDRKRSTLAQAALAVLSLVGLTLGLIVIGAFAAAWSATNAQLEQWIVSDLRVSKDGVAGWFATYALVAVVVVLLLVVPALRGFIQARVARRSTS